MVSLPCVVFSDQIIAVVFLSIVSCIEDDRFQPEYDKSIKYLDVDARINLLNRRLEVLKDLNSILMDAAHNQHATALEWIVIVLIVAEVAIEIYRGWLDN